MRRLRRWYWRHVRRCHGETCRDCGRAIEACIGRWTWWTTEDEFWRMVVPHNRVLCPRCFTRVAHAQGYSLRWRAEPVLYGFPLPTEAIIAEAERRAASRA